MFHLPSADVAGFAFTVEFYT